MAGINVLEQVKQPKCYLIYKAEKFCQSLTVKMF